MSTSFLQEFVEGTRRYKASIITLAAGCGYLLAGQAQTAEAAVPRRSAEDLQRIKAELNERLMTCNSKSMLDVLKQKRNYSPERMFSAAIDQQGVVLAGGDNCPGTNIPAGTSFSDSDTTVGANSTFSSLNGCIPFPNMQGPDKIYRFVLPAVGSRIPTCTATVDPGGTFDAGIYIVSQSGGGCPAGTGNSVTNCVAGDDNAPVAGDPESITDAQFDAMPAGVYYLVIDSFYCGPNGSGCGNTCTIGNPSCWNGTYTLNLSCTTLSPTAAMVGVGGRVTTAEGRGIAGARVSAVLPNGESRVALSNPFGFYHFDGIEVGNSYVFQVNHKSYEFPNNSQLVTVNDPVENLDFVAAGSTRSKDTKN